MITNHFQQHHHMMDLENLLKTFTVETSHSLKILRNMPLIYSEPHATQDIEHDVLELSAAVETIPLHPSRQTVTVVACDMSTVKLAETAEGPVWAVRGSIISRTKEEVKAFVVGPFAYTASAANIKNLLATLYTALDINRKQPSFSLSAAPKLVGNLFERILQLHAARFMRGGILLLDGSLTVGPLDSPLEAVSKIVEVAKQQGLGVAAFSKSTTLTLRGRSILSYLADVKPPYLIRIPVHDLSRWRVCKGTVYVSRLSQGYFPFRVDASSKESDAELFNALLSSEPIIYGYPESLILAHQLAKISRFDMISTRASLENLLNIRFIHTAGIRTSLFTPITHS
ncbi:MAG: DNA double-strand break repair nuclease NurA [Candidatus Caldarchaeum sp.]|nr:DNA double-strand break repair nuclease NurA [Candidatus Caldarchaeum sp.]